MDSEVYTRLKEISSVAQKYLDESNQELDKFQIALTGTLRLLDGNSAIIEKLHGNSENLVSYIIQQVTELKQNSTNRLGSLLEQLTELISEISDDDRNS